LAESCLAFGNDKSRALGHMVDDERGGSLRHVTAVTFLIAALALVGCGTLTLLPRQGDASPPKLLSVDELSAAYARVRPGATRASELVRLGFDPLSSNAQILSYLGVMERFMPRDTAGFDKLNAVIQDCVEARDRCSAMIFSAATFARSGVDGHPLSEIGFSAAVEHSVPQVMVFIRDGRVVFKASTGLKPDIARVEAPGASQGSVAERPLPVAYKSVD
jgi:hypothetical protein